MAGIGSIEVQLVANLTTFNKALDEASKRLEKFAGDSGKHAHSISASFLEVGKIMLEVFAWEKIKGFFEGLNRAAETVENLGKVARRLDIPVEQLSVLKFTADETGASFESLSKGFNKAGKAVAEMLKAGQTQTRVGQVLIDLEGANGQARDLSELLPEIARGIASAGSAAEQARLADKFFGKDSGAEMLSVIKEFPDALNALGTSAERARRLNNIFSQEQVDQLTEYVRAFKHVREAWFGLQVMIVTKIAPVVTDLLDQLASAMAAVPDIVGRLAKAFGDSADGAEVRQRLSNAMHWLWELFKEIFVGGLGTLFDTVGASLSARLRLATEDLGAQLMAVWAKTPFAGSDFQKEAAAAQQAVHRPYEDRLKEALASVDPISSETRWEQYGVNVRTFWEYFSDDLDKAGKVSDYLAQHSLKGLGQAVQDVGEKAKPLPEWIQAFNKRLQDFADEGGKKIQGFGQDVSNTFADLVVDGKASFDQLAKSFEKMLVSMALEKMAFGPLFQWAGNQFTSAFSPGGGSGSGSGGGPYTSQGVAYGAGIPGQAMGGAWLGGHLLAYARGGVVSSPTMFRMAGGMGLMGEAGPEAVMPLQRIGGKLGVQAAGAGVVVNVIDQRSSGARPEVGQSTGPDGRRMISVLIRDEVRNGIGQGDFDQALNQSFGLPRRGVRR